VNDLTEAAAFYRDILALEPSQAETADGASIVSVHVGDVEVELMQPLTADGPVARFLAKRGPGIHHVCYRVPNLDQALAACRERGYHLVNEVPRSGVGGRRIAFVHPKATGGVLLELTE
jgi:methylmalonyl-CoA/ethylmalonyl-CoA epimerase